MDHLSKVHTSYVLDFDFTNNITILTGSSGTGKTASFSFIKECMAINPDILLNDDTRKYISLDDKNQYLIIVRNPKNLFATSDNLFELVREKNGEQTEFRIKPYLQMKAECINQ